MGFNSGFKGLTDIQSSCFVTLHR